MAPFVFLCQDDIMTAVIYDITYKVLILATALML